MKALIGFLVFFGAFSGNCQLAETDTLFVRLKTSDSLLFTVGFNTCDLSQFEALVHKDFAFYHDQGGVTTSKKTFIKQIKTGICSSSDKPSRMLIEGSLNVFPLFKNGVIYGAIQTGEHGFYANEEGQSPRLTSTALFTHLWLLEDEKWLLSRVYSYNHHVPDSNE